MAAKSNSPILSQVGNWSRKKVILMRLALGSLNRSPYSPGLDVPKLTPLPESLLSPLKD